MARDRKKRRFDRVGGRLPCQIRCADAVHRAFATNLSAGGFFLQTRLQLEPGIKIVVELECEETMTLTGAIARLQSPHPSVASVIQPGLGFRLESAPEGYFQLVMGLYAPS